MSELYGKIPNFDRAVIFLFWIQTEVPHITNYHSTLVKITLPDIEEHLKKNLPDTGIHESFHFCLCPPPPRNKIPVKSP